MSRGAACGPPFGMGWDVESSGGPVVFPGCWVLLWGIGVVTGLSGVNIARVFALGLGVGVTFGGCHPIPFLRPFDSAQGERNSPPLGMDSSSQPAAGMTWEKGVEGSRLGGGCAFRRDGFLPPQE